MYLMKNLPNLTGDGGGKPEKIKQKKSLKLFAHLVMMVMVLASRLHFFVRVAIGLVIGGVVGLAIDGVVSMGTDVIVDFSRLSLW